MGEARKFEKERQQARAAAANSSAHDCHHGQRYFHLSNCRCTGFHLSGEQETDAVVPVVGASRFGNYQDGARQIVLNRRGHLLRRDIKPSIASMLRPIISIHTLRWSGTSLQP